MAKKGKELIYEAFEDRKSAIVVGFLCLIYFFVLYSPESDLIAKILPAWPLTIFGVIAAVCFVLQVIVWKIFRHFHHRWYLHIPSVALFACEFGLILFTMIFLSWPVFYLYQLLTSQNKG